MAHEIAPARIAVEINYMGGIGYWARVNGEDVGIYDPDWPRFARKLGDDLLAENPLHPRTPAEGTKA